MNVPSKRSAKLVSSRNTHCWWATLLTHPASCVATCSTVISHDRQPVAPMTSNTRRSSGRPKAEIGQVAEGQVLVEEYGDDQTVDHRHRRSSVGVKTPDHMPPMMMIGIIRAGPASLKAAHISRATTVSRPYRSRTSFHTTYHTTMMAPP